MSNESTSPLPIDDLLRIWYAAYDSFNLMAACQLDLFTPLKDGALTAAELASALGVQTDRLAPLLYALVPCNLLAVDGDGCFRNSPLAARYLVRGESAYAGGIHSTYDLAYHAMLKTAESIRSGRPQALHDYSSASDEEQMAMLRGLSQSAARVAGELMQACDLSECRSLLDVGGGSGALAAAFADAFPTLTATVADLPAVTPYTHRLIAEAPARARLHVLPTDVTREPLTGAYDAAVMLRFIQALAPDDARNAIINTARAIRPGGAIFIVGAMLDDSRLSPLVTVAANVMFLSIYDGGRAHTESEHRAWLDEAGCDFVRCIPMSAGFSAIEARKRMKL
ncbi:MAG: methyltransferase domain-containing protein [Chloroflexi bacterium]|nr:methyltransferase domain-containing protein [Chloroflexota bacterium]